MNNTTHFAPASISHLNQLDVLDNAYATAGLEAPSRVNAISEVLAKEPEPHEVAEQYAIKSIHGNINPEELTEEALAAWQRATNVEAFRNMYLRVVDGVTTARSDELRTNAVKDLTKPFNSLIKQLEKVSAKLDKEHPLDRQVAFEQDTTAALKEAEAILARLSDYAITPTAEVRGKAAKILSIVSLPNVEPEKVTRTWSRELYVDPKDKDPNRNAIRTVMRMADSDIDATLIRIARGVWKNIIFAIADNEEMARREQAHHNAMTRVNVPDRNTDHLVPTY